MKGTLTEKILSKHLVVGELKPGAEIGIAIDQTLTQDATGSTAFLLFEAMDIPRVRAELAVSYVDHNMAQFGPESHNDHLYLQSVAARVGAWFSRPGNGICHQVHLERFARPGRTLLGSDSHTPTAGGMGSFAVGAGGLDVAVAMGGAAFYLTCPKVVGVQLRGRLRPWVAPKDVILRLLSILTTRGNVGVVVEYFGQGVTGLSVPGRATCTNMGAELGVTTSLFPSDQVTAEFLASQGRGGDFEPLVPDDDAQYDRATKKLDPAKDAGVIENIRRWCPDARIGQPSPDGRVEVSFSRVVIDLSELEPLMAAPGSPENIVRVADLEGTPVDQVVIGSCTNSSFADMMVTAGALKGRHVHPRVELGISPGSRQVLGVLARNGALADMVAAGARVLECSCGPCIGQGFSPGENRVSLRTVNRNFTGRSGTSDDRVYLVSPETAVAAALTGRITDPRKLGIEYPAASSTAVSAVSITRVPPVDTASNSQSMGETPMIPTGKMPVLRGSADDGMLVPPQADGLGVEVIRGSTIVKPPSGTPAPADLTGLVLIKVGDKITTDHIMPAGALMKYRSNVPEYAKYVFNSFNEPGQPTFAQRAQAARQVGRQGVIVAGDSYGQGSSREHAALCPMHLGVRVVIAKAIERIHQANLVNFAIVPLTFADAADYDRLKPDDKLEIPGLAKAIESADAVTVRMTTVQFDLDRGDGTTRAFDFTCRLSLSPRQRKILLAGGLLAYTRQGGK